MKIVKSLHLICAQNQQCLFVKSKISQSPSVMAAIIWLFCILIMIHNEDDAIGLKVLYKLLMVHHLTATGPRLPYGITQYYLPPDTSERAPP